MYTNYNTSKFNCIQLGLESWRIDIESGQLWRQPITCFFTHETSGRILCWLSQNVRYEHKLQFTFQLRQHRIPSQISYCIGIYPVCWSRGHSICLPIMLKCMCYDIDTTIPPTMPELRTILRMAHFWEYPQFRQHDRGKHVFNSYKNSYCSFARSSQCTF